MRPDERANQELIERDKRFRGNLKSAAGAALGTGLSMASSKVLPFLSEYLPVDLAMRGLDKVSPAIGKFLRKGQSMGLDIKEGMNYVKEQIIPKKETEQPQEKRNIIEQYSPELHQFIDQEVRKGRPLIQVGAIAQNDRRFADVINKLQKDHKTPWSNILQSIYGGALKEQPQDQGQMQPGGGQGNIDPALQQLIQQGNSILQKFKGG
jgi:hypothetical protein